MNDVYLHIGPVKTGSTYLQSIMWNSRDLLRARGLLLPADHDNEHFLAANDVQDGKFVLIDLPEADGIWDKVAGRARSWPGPVLISHELLGFSESDHIRRIVDSLAPSTLHLIVMARCRADVLPSLYQEKIKMVDPDQSWGDFLAEYRHSEGPWSQAPGVLVQRWLPHIDRDRVHVVTVPKRGAGGHLLLYRFAGVLGLDLTELRIDDADTNTSLDAVEVELLRVVTARTAARLDRRAQRDLINAHLVPLLRELDRPRRRLRLPASLRPLMSEAGLDDAEILTAAECHVHGNLDELMPDAEAFDDDRPAESDVSLTDVLMVAADALVAAATRLPRSGETAYGFAVGLYPMPDYPTLPTRPGEED